MGKLYYALCYRIGEILWRDTRLKQRLVNYVNKAVSVKGFSNLEMLLENKYDIS